MGGGSMCVEHGASLLGRGTEYSVSIALESLVGGKASLLNYGRAAHGGQRRALGHNLDVTSLSLFDLSHHFPFPFFRADVLSVISLFSGSFPLLRAGRVAVSSCRPSPLTFQPRFPRLPTPFHHDPISPRIVSWNQITTIQN
jgi:hypothetical protein